METDAKTAPERKEPEVKTEEQLQRECCQALRRAMIMANSIFNDGDSATAARITRMVAKMWAEGSPPVAGDAKDRFWSAAKAASGLWSARVVHAMQGHAELCDAVAASALADLMVDPYNRTRAGEERHHVLETWPIVTEAVAKVYGAAVHHKVEQDTGCVLVMAAAITGSRSSWARRTEQSSTHSKQHENGGTRSRGQNQGKERSRAAARQAEVDAKVRAGELFRVSIKSRELTTRAREWVRQQIGASRKTSIFFVRATQVLVDVGGITLVSRILNKAKTRQWTPDLSWNGQSIAVEEFLGRNKQHDQQDTDLEPGAAAEATRTAAPTRPPPTEGTNSGGATPGKTPKKSRAKARAPSVANTPQPVKRQLGQSAGETALTDPSAAGMGSPAKAV